MGTCHHTRLIFVLLVEMWFHHVGQAGLKLLTSGDPPASASQIAGITDVGHCDLLLDQTYCKQLPLQAPGNVVTPGSLEMPATGEPQRECHSPGLGSS
ncbi:hypothetical protein AAY473_028768 [Plecturocebus cupreus]